MKSIFITLDYELYFGKSAGTVDNSIITPTERLIEILNKYGIKASFFIDCGYLIKLKEYKQKFPSLNEDYDKVTQQLRKLTSEGHDLQLHIHPHWEDSYYDGNVWVMDTTRYRLNSFTKEEINLIVYNYKKVLEEYSNNQVFAFRAGGWCIQPFAKLKEAFKINNIWLDSTVFKGGNNNSQTHYFNFKKASSKSYWKFEDDPLQEVENGFFHEIPISSFKVSPLFFWKLAITKKNGKKEHNNFGDGSAAGGSKWDLLRMLTRSTHTVVSMDGYKSVLLNKAFKKFKGQNFVIIGHPKALSEFSLDRLDKFLEKNRSHNFITYSNWVSSKKVKAVK